MKDRTEITFIARPGGEDCAPVSYYKLLSIISLGSFLIMLSIISMCLDPIHILARYMVRIEKGAPVYEFLQDDIKGAIIALTMFNITNAEEFVSGKDYKLKMHEVGPFTYSQVRTNHDLSVDTEAGILRYTPHNNFTFLPEKSVADPKIVNLTVPDISMMSVSAMVSKYSYITRFGFNVLTRQLNSKALMNINADKYIWGYSDPIIATANKFVPGLVNFDTMGIMDRLYDRAATFKFEVSTKPENKFSIITLNGRKEPKTWEFVNSDYQRCLKNNSFVNTYEGLMYPTDTNPETPITVHHTGLCRILDMEYSGRITLEDDVNALVFQIKNKSFTLDPEDKCLCTGGTCADGILDMSFCYYGLPLGLTNARFLDADPILYERIEGLTPADPSEDRSTVYIEPMTGAALFTKLSLQINIILKDVSFNPEMKPFSNMVIPIVRATLALTELPEDVKYRMRLMYKVGPNILLTLEILLLLTGLLLITYAVRLYWKRVYSDSKRRLKLFHKKKKSNAEEPLTT